VGYSDVIKFTVLGTFCLDRDHTGQYGFGEANSRGLQAA